MRRYLVVWVGLVVAALLSGCATITKFDQNSYNAAQELKAEALATMAHPTPTMVDGLRARLDAQVAYEAGKGKANAISAAQWKLLGRTDGHLLGGWIKEYRAGQVMSPAYVEEKQAQVGRAFDEILKLEGGKLR